MGVSLVFLWCVSQIQAEMGATAGQSFSIVSFWESEKNIFIRKNKLDLTQNVHEFDFLWPFFFNGFHNVFKYNRQVKFNFVYYAFYGCWVMSMFSLARKHEHLCTIYIDTFFHFINDCLYFIWREFLSQSLTKRIFVSISYEENFCLYLLWREFLSLSIMNRIFLPVKYCLFQRNL